MGLQSPLEDIGGGGDGSSSPVVVVALTVAVVFVTAILLLLATKKNKDGSATGGKKHKRRLSFTSVGLGIGSFPPAANVKEPIINAALYFNDGDCPSEDDVATHIVKPLLEYERLSTVPDLKGRTCRPCKCQIRPGDLVRRIDIQGDEALTHRTIIDHLQDGLGHGRDDKPWWEMLVIRNAGSGSDVCVMRFHHVLGDGVAFVTAMEKILMTEDGTDVIGASTGSALSVLKNSSSSSSSGVGDSNSAGRNKSNCCSATCSLAEALGHVLTLAATKYDDDTAFSKMNHSETKHSGRRGCVLFPTVPLDFVKRLKSAASVSVNDILTTAVSQAIHDYCVSCDDPLLTPPSPPSGGDGPSEGKDKDFDPSKIQCRALLPVGFPRPPSETSDKSTAMRNKWCMVSCDVGVGHRDVMDRLDHVHAQTQTMKSKPRAYVQLAVQNKLGPYVPTKAGQQTVFDTFSRHSLVLTNVPGPTQTVLFAGHKVRDAQLFFDNLITQVDLISYAGKVYGNMVYDMEELPFAQERFGVFYGRALKMLADRLDVDCPAELKEEEPKLKEEPKGGGKTEKK